MNRAPRCPVCRTPLTADRTIEELYRPDDASWDYRYSCPSCLSVAVQSIPEISEARPRVAGSSPVVDIAAAVVTRVIASLRESAEQGRLAETVASLVEDERRRVLLRVPEVFAVARPGWGEVVRLAGPVWYPSSDASMFEEGRAASTILARYDPDRVTSIRIVLHKEDRFRVLRAEDARFVLARIPPSASDRILDPRELVATPDLLLPDLGSGA